MRKLLLLCFVLLGSLLSAQNWALINPDYKYNYSNDGTDTIAGQISVTHIDTLGADTLLFTLKGRAEFCDTCLNGTGGLASACDGCYIWSDVPEFPGRTVISGPDGWYLTDGDTSLIKTQAQLGAVWNFSSDGTMAEIILAATATVLGVPDSIKYVSTTSMDTLILSKEHGILYYHRGGASTLGLIGIEGLGLGVFKPPFEAFFPYHPGDILDYDTYEGGIDGIGGGYGGDKIFKMTVTGIAPSDSSLDVVVNSICNSAGDGGYIPACGACGTDTFHISADELPYFNILWSKPGELLNPSEYACMDTYFPVMTKHYRDGEGRYHITTTVKIRTAYAEAAAFLELTPTAIPTLYGYRPADFSPMEDTTFGLHYVSGIGLLSFRREVFETWEGYYLNGAVIAGDTIGTLTPDGVILGTNILDDQAELRAGPVPADDLLHVFGGSSLEEVQVWNMQGQLLLSRSTPSTQVDLDVSDLAPGVYVLHVIDLQGQRTQPFIIAR